jgi:hypothetical protein
MTYELYVVKNGKEIATNKKHLTKVRAKNTAEQLIVEAPIFEPDIEKVIIKDERGKIISELQSDLI